MKNAKRILEKFDSWKYDIYENNKSDWTKEDDKDVDEIEKLVEQQTKKNLPTQDNVKRLMEQTLRNILSCVGGVYYNKYKLKLERKKKNGKKIYR